MTVAMPAQRPIQKNMKPILSRICLVIILTCLVSCVPDSLDDPSRLELTNEVVVDGLADRIERVLQTELKGRRLSSTDNAAWQIMHGVICYGHELPLDTPDRGTVFRLGLRFHEGSIRGWQLMPGQLLSDVGAV